MKEIKNNGRPKRLFLKLDYRTVFLLLCSVIIQQGAFASKSVHEHTYTTVPQTAITGTVTDESGVPLPGATVLEVGTSNGVSTDFDGNYTIVPSGDSPVLEFSYIGYATKTITVNGQTSINVVLAEDASELEEVVVTGLGITRAKKAIGYAVATVEAESLVEAAPTNFATALYGKAPGVQIAATPGGNTSAVNINIRGLNSINGSNQPLIIKDGIPIRNQDVSNSNYWSNQRVEGNGLLDINPEDIENISILKGASAAALYGSEAVNGVVLITTKKGKGKGWSGEFNSVYSFDNVAYMPKWQNERGPGYPWYVATWGDDVDEDGFQWYDTNGDGTPDTKGVIGTNLNYGPRFDGQPILAWDGKVRPYTAQNSYEGLFKTAHNTRFNVGLSHVSDKANTRFSYTRSDNQAITPNSSNYNNTFSLNSNIDWTDNFRTQVVVDYYNKKVHNRPYKIDRIVNNFGGMMNRFDNADWYEDQYKTSLGYRYVTGSGQSLTPDENITIPGYRGDILDYFWRINEYDYEEASDRVIAALTLEYDFLNDFTLRARASHDFTSEYTEDKRPTEIPLVYNNTTGMFGMRQKKDNVKYGELLLTYNKAINDDFSVLARLGYNAEERTNRMTQLQTVGGLTVENWFDLSASRLQPTTANLKGWNNRDNYLRDGIFGTLNLDYKGFLYVEGTIRRDRISTIPAAYNGFTYPSVNGSFVVSQAFELPQSIDLLKVRGSWGVVGNAPELYAANIAYTQLGINGSETIYTTLPTQYGNDQIKPEEKHEIEFGLELKMLQNRIGLDVSYYDAEIRDQILQYTLPRSTGAQSVLANIGILGNKGLEVGLNGSPIRTSDVDWSLGINFSRNVNTVKKLTDDSDQLVHQDQDGSAVRLVSNVGEAMGDIMVHPLLTDENGNNVVSDNGLYLVDSDEWVKAGNVNPDFIGGIWSSLSVKNFSLDFSIDYSWGGEIMPKGYYWMVGRGLTEESLAFSDAARGGISYYPSQVGDDVQLIQTSSSQGPAGESVYNDGIILEGVKTDGTPNDIVVSNPDYFWTVYNWGGPAYSPNARYDLFVRENNYLKMREISIGYSIPKDVVEKTGLSSINLSVFGRNLFYLYRSIKEVDGEAVTVGTDWKENWYNGANGWTSKTVGLQLRASF
ncbi:SusC/RagA family TonB-linked outer membrane protein [Pseudozobellia thermophila]|uniref:TonB-linked outer membrane protein, SusC/RagA family n=1 Tax=Pseudozobellia thermophila TaxID=192903 RepID=A0A1M6MXS1_9FLAO|nr:SusC/RagA family TonB-linked outer membrane protein [Pseudozobellia thermophila]SHJ88202.1 TonB-linked outer membrane protein, SusC/RagA family [Pseudozobellia thermophila]